MASNSNVVEARNRRSYLVTYSQADLNIVSTKKEFAEKVVNAFTQGKVKVIQWAACEELHEDLNPHFHMVLKLNQPCGWKGAKTRLQDEGIVVHFEDGHAMYNAGYQYVCKEDPAVLHSEKHPRLFNLHTSDVSTAAAVTANMKQRSKRTVTVTTDTNEAGEVTTREKVVDVVEAKQSKKVPRLTTDDVSEVIVEQNIKDVTELLALAQERRDEGQRDLSSYVLRHGKAKIAETLDLTWAMRSAADDVKRKAMTRLEILSECGEEDCVDGCGGKWYDLAVKVLTDNDVLPHAFANAVWNLLKQGRKKHLNIMIVGPSNCGKSFLLQPLHQAFKIFANPAQNKFAWTGVEKAEVIFLNDFHWSSELIPFDTFLRLLEGQSRCLSVINFSMLQIYIW